MNEADILPVLDEALAQVFADADVPAQLQASVDRHRANLIQLVQTLYAAGINESQIELSVNTIVASYKEELLSAIKSLMKDRP